MPTITLTRGIPASGKSSWAKAWVQEDPQHRIRVNRDDLRAMLYGATEMLLTWEQEQNVTAVERAIATTALEKGKDVVVDAMNLRARWVRQWFTLGYDVEYRDFPVDLHVALARNATRTNPIPREVIENAYLRLTKLGQLPPPPTNDGPNIAPYAPDWNLPGAYLFDIDGTLAHMTGRSPYDYSRVHEDAVDREVAHLLNALGDTHQIVIMSGREDGCRDVTERWLTDNNIRYDELYMRAADDKRQDATVKTELFNTHIRDRFNVHGVIDDRNQVVRAWRDLGLKCYQAAEGAF
jgi:predicted kinase